MICRALSGRQTIRRPSGGPGSGLRGRPAAILPGSMRESPCDACSAGAILTGPSAPGRSRARPRTRGFMGILERRPAEPETLGVLSSPVPRDPARFAIGGPIHRCRSTLDRDHIDRMDAKQVWRAALGELQVSLSPANFETWLRDTQLVDVDEQRFRIGVPNGFAKDWLENRYRSL